MSGTVDMEDGRASLHHRAVAEWLVSDGAPPPLRVAVPAARQAMTDAVMAWLAPVIGDDSGIHSPLIYCFNGLFRRRRIEATNLDLNLKSK